MPEIKVEQNTDEWLQLRVGSIGASSVADATAKGKGNKPSAGRKNTVSRIVAEKLSGKFSESYTNAAMQRGHDLEPQARSAYEFLTGNTVRECGLFRHPQIDGVHASPDGVVTYGGEDIGLLEIKCPQTSAHLETLLKREVPSQYIKQIQMQMACAEQSWCDFVSFNPDFPAGLDAVVIRVDRDDALISELEATLVDVNSEIDEVINQLAETYGGQTWQENG